MTIIGFGTDCGTFYSGPTAKRIARKLHETDPDWTYTPIKVNSRSDWWKIRIIDEDGQFVGFWHET